MWPRVIKVKGHEPPIKKKTTHITNRIEPGLMLHPENLITQGGYKDGHEGTKVVEEAVREIYKRADTQHGSLCHATGIPRDEDGRNRHTILGRTAEQTRFVAPLTVGVTKHTASKDDAEVLVGRDDIEKDTHQRGTAHKRHRVAYQTEYGLHDAIDHPRNRHGSPEDGSTEDKPYGAHHATHATCRHQIIERRHPRIERCLARHQDHGGAEMSCQHTMISASNLV